MKTYNFVYVLLACLIIGCSKDTATTTDPEKETTALDVSKANYQLVVQQNNQLVTKAIAADGDKLAISTAESLFADMANPNLFFKDANYFSCFSKNTDCSANLTLLGFDSSKSEYTFNDLDCNTTYKAVTHDSNNVYLLYEAVNTPYIRVINRNKESVDILIETGNNESFTAIDFQVANNSLFIIAQNNNSDEFFLLVYNVSTKQRTTSKNLGNDVLQLFKVSENSLVVSYPELHSLINTSTLAISYLNYAAGTSPNFTDAEIKEFDSTGNMYYKRNAGENSTYSYVPSYYDFQNNVAYIYAYENFLTEKERLEEYKIETTTVVSYDEANDLLLVGYKKIDSNTGGIMRIKLAPEPKFVDNLDVGAVPFMIYVKP